jgi:hypothetical protein
MLYKTLLTWFVFSMAHAMAMEEEGHHCCPKGESVCTCHHHKHEHEPDLVQAPSLPAKTAALPHKSHLESISDVHVPKILKNVVQVVDTPIARSEPDAGLGASINLSSARGANIAANPDSKVNPELPSETFHASKSDITGPKKVDDSHPKKVGMASPTSKHVIPDPAASETKIRYFKMEVPLEGRTPQERGNFLRAIVYNKGKKIEGAFEIKAEPKEAIEGDFLLPEELENDFIQEEVLFIKSWLEQLLSTKTVEINLISLILGHHPRQKSHLQDHHPQAHPLFAKVERLQIS